MRTLISSTKISFQRAALGALFLFCAPVHSALAAPNATQIAAFENAPETERVKLLMHLAKNGQHDDAGFLLESYPLQGPHAPNRTLYIEGLILNANGDHTGAVEKYRSALASDPKLTLVRAELAKTLAVLEQDDSAKHHLNLLAAEAPTEGAAQEILSFLEKIDSRKPYTISGYVSLAPSTNMNQGSKRKTVFDNSSWEISDSSKAKSGIGFSWGWDAAYSKRLGNDFTFIVAGGVDSQIYKDKDFNQYETSQSLEVRRMFERGYLGLGAVASQSLSHNKKFITQVTYGPRVSASMRVSSKDQLSAGATYEWRDNLAAGAADSTALSLNSTWTHGFSSTLSATAFGGLTLIDSDVDVNSYNTKSAGLTVYNEFSYGITTKLTAQVLDTNYDKFNPFIGVKRHDTRLMGSLELTKRDLNYMGFAPSISYSFTENISNQNLYDYTTHAVDFRLTRDF
jgi:outer membrane protein